MNEAVAKQWVAALRSGRYEQGRGQLLLDGKFCCLGVLCDISGLGRWQDGHYMVGDGKYNTLPPVAVTDWAELEIYVSLSSRNDGISGYLPHTFAQIADLIEERWREL